ncbi:TetR/AcrR family transcriptional regulator [Nocardia sp. NPDC057663]|uniref:TetR/AcrR family transcriptional regulator n=1 Tax=Nocardia sp. NPDC057663 TaxID=3346201 RepID=UPI00366F41B0
MSPSEPTGNQAHDTLLRPILVDLPRGPHSLPKALVVGAQRQRLLHAVAAVACQRGYQAMTIGDITASAGVSRKTFYENFADKEACFLAAAETGRDLIKARIEAEVAAVAGQSEPSVFLRLALRAYLAVLRDEPTFAQAFYVETQHAGPAAQQAFEDCQQWFAASSAGWRALAFPDLAPVPEQAYLAAIVATNDAVRRCLRVGRIAELPDLEDLLIYFHRTLLAVPEASL